MAYIISADEIKKTLQGYDPRKSEDFHRESTKLADKEFKKALKTRPEKTVILLSGGTASGKSEYVSVYLSKRKVIVFDGTLPTLEGAEIKISKAAKAGKPVQIHAVLSESLQIAFSAFLNRERKFSPEHFYRTHSQSRKTLLEIAKAYPEIPIKLIRSRYQKVRDLPSMRFEVLEDGARGGLIEFLEQNQYTEDEIKRELEVV